MMDWSASILYAGISLSKVRYRMPNEEAEENRMTVVSLYTLRLEPTGRVSCP